MTLPRIIVPHLSPFGLGLLGFVALWIVGALWALWLLP